MGKRSVIVGLRGGRRDGSSHGTDAMEKEITYTDATSANLHEKEKGDNEVEAKMTET